MDTENTARPAAGAARNVEKNLDTADLEVCATTTRLETEPDQVGDGARPILLQKR
jgi:hypothetical protein